MIRDFDTTKIDDVLQGKVFDWVVTGSIAVVEVVKAIRALRRLGAQVRVTMTKGALRFISQQACEWASANKVVVRYSGFSDHLAENDALIVAPLTASFAAKAGAGITDTPALSLFSSYVGSGKQIIVHPNMHMSLWQNPLWQANYQRLHPHVHVLEPVLEEGRQKFLVADVFADRVASVVNRTDKHAIVCMGRTEGEIDRVRYIGNSSSGEMGAIIASYLYRRGFITHVVRGACEATVHSYDTLSAVRDPQEMHTCLQKILKANPTAALVMVAAVLDYAPEKPVAGKIPSSAQELVVRLVPVPKIIKHLKPDSPLKIVFKLQEKFDAQVDQKRAETLFAEAAASAVVVNACETISSDKYEAYAYLPHQQPVQLSGKKTTAKWICKFILQKFQ